MQRTRDLVCGFESAHHERGRARAESAANVVEDVDPVGGSSETQIEHDQVGPRSFPLAHRCLGIAGDAHVPLLTQHIPQHAHGLPIVFDDQDPGALLRLAGG